MEWVAIDIDIAGDPVVHRMADALRLRPAEIVGLLTLTFGGMAKHAPTGNVGAIPDTLLETWATWHGKRSAFARQFRAELCDDAGLVRAWEHYNGRNIRRAKAAIERTRKWRETQARDAAEASPNANGDAHVTHNGTHDVCRTVQNSTVPNKEPRATDAADAAPVPAIVKRPRPPRAESWVTEGVTLWQSIAGTVAHGEFGAQLKPMIDMHGWPAVRPDMEKWLREQIAAGKGVKPAWYAGVVSARLAKKPPIVNEHGELTEYGERITRPDKVPA